MALYGALAPIVSVGRQGFFLEIYEDADQYELAVGHEHAFASQSFDTWEDAWQAYLEACEAAHISPPLSFGFATESTPAQERPADPIDLLAFYRSQLTHAGVGSDRATEIREEMMKDPVIIENRHEIRNVCSGTSWIDALIRAACNRIDAREKEQARIESETAYTDVTTFGMF